MMLISALRANHFEDISCNFVLICPIQNYPPHLTLIFLHQYKDQSKTLDNHCWSKEYCQHTVSELLYKEETRKICKKESFPPCLPLDNLKNSFLDDMVNIDTFW